MSLPTTTLTSKQEQAMALRNRGLTYLQIGQEMGVRPQRAGQLVSTARRKMAPSPNEVHALGLSTRTYTALARAGITTLAGLREAADQPRGLIGHVRNLGLHGQAEALEALARFGPHCGTCSCLRGPLSDLGTDE